MKPEWNNYYFLNNNGFHSSTTNWNHQLTKKTTKVDVIKTIIKSVVEELFKGYQETIVKKID